MYYYLLDCVWKICGHSIERLKKLEKYLLDKKIKMSQPEINHKTRVLTKLSSSLTTKPAPLKHTTKKKELVRTNKKIMDKTEQRFDSIKFIIFQ
jgi:hypothetical protein